LRRFGGLFDEVVSFANLVAAAKRAARGKACSPEVSLFSRDLETEVLRLQREVVSGDYRPGTYHTFVISDPKVRQITVAPFRDRVLHHAVCGVMEPYLERLFIHDSYACRLGKGTCRALTRAQQLSRRNAYFLKLDVQSYFHSVNHDVLMTLLDHRFKDRRLLALLEIIVRHQVPNCADGCGLPIGNLTSQHLANYYLNALDQFIVNGVQPGGYLRYMDDMVLFSDDKTVLWCWHDRVGAFLGDQLRLELKDTATLLAPVSQGLPFLGRRIYPGLVRFRRENLRRLLQRWRRRRRACSNGRLAPHELARSEEAIFAHLTQANSLRLRQHIVTADGDDSGQTPGTGSNRVIRGGNWNNNAQNCRSANRNNNNPDNTNNNIGFRSVNSWQSQEVGIHGCRHDSGDVTDVASNQGSYSRIPHVRDDNTTPFMNRD
jgi:RNA-directed DNA polymerase